MTCVELSTEVLPFNASRVKFATGQVLLAVLSLTTWQVEAACAKGVVNARAQRVLPSFTPMTNMRTAASNRNFEDAGQSANALATRCASAGQTSNSGFE